MKAIFCALLSSLILPSLVLSRTIIIPRDYPTIQQGITAAVNGDSVLVDTGAYTESIHFQGKQIVVRSIRGPDVTIIDPNLSGPVVSFIQREGRGAVIEGFTITNSDSQPNPDMTGVRCGEGSSPVIVGNIIVNNGNLWLSMGGGIIAENSNPIIEKNKIIRNRAIYNGGGICIMNGCDAVIRGNEIIDNYCSSGYGFANGGGIYIGNSSAEIERNLIVGNVADPNFGLGGGICIEGQGNVRVRGNTFANNDGKCVFIRENPPHGAPNVVFINNIVTGTPSGNGIEVQNVPHVKLDFNDFWNNNPANYAGVAPGRYDISENPLFIPGPRHNFYLAGNSPCVDAGSFIGGLDPDGSRLDIGAFHFNQESVNVAIIPGIWPVVVPPGGGSFDFDIHLLNNTAAATVFDVWLDVTLPDSSIIGPLQLRQGFVFNPGRRAQRGLSQRVPPGAPQGEYLYIISAGEFAAHIVYHQTLMPFVKSGSGGGDNRWEPVKWEADDGGISRDRDSARPKFKAAPNPFNNRVEITVELPLSSTVTVEIFNILGEKIASLADGYHIAGIHRFTFDSADLHSGVYFCRFNANGYSEIGKIVLLK